MSVILEHASSICGEIKCPTDKSLTHRAVMLAALADGDTDINNFLLCSDTVSTVTCFQKMGISIEDCGNSEIIVHGKGMYGLTKPNAVLNAGNSGTTVRLLSAILSAQSFSSEICGDDSLNRRAMSNILKPLNLMGADIHSKAFNDCTPLLINGHKLHGITYKPQNISNQVKSSLLFAALFADSPTVIYEPYISRNHTEAVMSLFGVSVTNSGTTVRLDPPKRLIPCNIDIPGDLSSAAFLIAAALIIPNSELLIRHVGINETRLGFITAIQAMGGNISLQNAKGGIEPCADIYVKSSKLHGITIEKDLIPAVFDELPILTVIACFAEGTTIIHNAEELKHKESNRIDALTENLKRMGANITALDDGFIIEGGSKMHGAIVGSRLDHRIAMSLAVAGLCSEGKTELIGSECVSISYPNFYNDIQSLCKYN